LSVQEGDVVIKMENAAKDGWIRAAKESDQGTIGFVPESYMQQIESAPPPPAGTPGGTLSHTPGKKNYKGVKSRLHQKTKTQEDYEERSQMLRERNEDLAAVGSEQRKQRMREDDNEQNFKAHMERQELVQQRELAVEMKRQVDYEEARQRRESIESRHGELTRSQKLVSTEKNEELQGREERLKSDMDQKHRSERIEFQRKISNKQSSGGGAFGSSTRS
jgi:hypothetical protein